MNPILLAMHGLPRSGKSTIVDSLRRSLGAPVVRRDAIRLALHGKRFHAEAEPMVKGISTYMIKSLFLAGHEIVICDETNISSSARNSLRAEGWDIVWYPVLTPLQTCLERAVATEQPDLVPVITEMWGRHEPLELGDHMFVDVTDKGTLVSTQIVEEMRIPEHDVPEVEPAPS